MDNPVDGLLRRLDGFQQRHRWVGFGFAVVRKYGDDQAGHYAALLAYYAFLSVFPLLLVLVSVLGIALRDNPDLRTRVLDSGLASFPVIGDQQRADIHSPDRSGIALVVGLVTTFVGARGLADAAQTAFNQLWQVPFTSRPGFPKSLLRSLVQRIPLTGRGTTRVDELQHHMVAIRVVVHALYLTHGLPGIPAAVLGGVREVVGVPEGRVGPPLTFPVKPLGRCSARACAAKQPARTARVASWLDPAAALPGVERRQGVARVQALGAKVT